MDTHTPLGAEWQTLQHNYENYETLALKLKLLSVLLCLIGLVLGVDPIIMLCAVALLWLQEGIWRTFQARLGERLLRVEALVRQSATADQAFQLHSEWLEARKGGLALVGEYAAHACRPTVAFPHALLALMVVLLG